MKFFLKMPVASIVAHQVKLLLTATSNVEVPADLQLLFFWSNFLLMWRQQKMAQEVGPPPACGRPAQSSWLRLPDYCLAHTWICGHSGNEPEGGRWISLCVSSSLSVVTLPFKRVNKLTLRWEDSKTPGPWILRSRAAERPSVWPFLYYP